jgi:opacity protein-like surface antigen
MIKNKLIHSTTVSPQVVMETTTVQDKKAAESTCRLIKLASISLVCSGLFVYTSNAIVVPNPVDADKPIHVRNPIHMHKSKPVDKPIVVHKEVHIKTTTQARNNIYIKAGAGAMFYEKFKAIEFGYFKKAPKTTPAYNIGIGYRINDSVRTDLNLQYAGVRYKANYLRQNIKTTAAFVNGYYDINSNKHIVPYLTLGIGVGNNRAGYLKTDEEPLRKGRDITNFVWNLGAGAMFKANKNFALDLGYKYMDLGHTKTNDGKSLSDRGGKQRIRSHQILGSLIYNF